MSWNHKQNPIPEGVDQFIRNINVTMQNYHIAYIINLYHLG